MHIAADRARLRYGLFILVALLINSVDGTLVRSQIDLRRQLILALASSFDLVLVVAGMYYWLLIRPGTRPKTSLVLVIVIGAIRAGFLFPIGGVRMIVAGACELGLIGGVGILARQIRKAGRDTAVDPVEAIRTVVRTALPFPIAVDALTGELAILYYALFSWGEKPHIPPYAQALTNYKKVGQVDLLSTLAVACALEIVPAHLLLRQWNSTVAWVSTGLSVYALIWMIGLARSFRLRPTLISQNSIHLRYGLMFQLQVPRSAVACAGRVLANPNPFAVPRRAESTHYLKFSRGVTAERLFGFRRRLSQVALTFDDPGAFERTFAQTSQ